MKNIAILAGLDGRELVDIFESRSRTGAVLGKSFPEGRTGVRVERTLTIERIRQTCKAERGSFLKRKGPAAHPLQGKRGLVDVVLLPVEGGVGLDDDVFVGGLL